MRNLDLIKNASRLFSCALITMFILATPADAQLELTDAEAIIAGKQTLAEAGWGEAYQDWRLPNPIIDLASRAYMGTVTTSSSVENQDWSAANLGDGLPWMYAPQVRTRECVHCGWIAAEDDPNPAVEVRFREGRAALISAVVLDTRAGKFHPFPFFHFPDGIRILIRESATSEFVLFNELEMPQTQQRHLIPLPPGTLAETVRVEILGTHMDEAPVLANIEVWEAAEQQPSLSEGLVMDLAEPSAGGRILHFSGFDESPPDFALRGGDGRAWRTDDSNEPKVIALAFGQHRRVQVSEVSLRFAPDGGLPARVRLEASDLDRGIRFEPFANVSLADGQTEIKIAVERPLRHLRAVLVGGDSQLSVEKIAVLEGQSSEFPPLHTRLEPDPLIAPSTDEQQREGRDEREPNDDIDNAQQLEIGANIAGQLTAGDRDVYAIPEANVGTVLLTVDAPDAILDTLEFLDTNGGVAEGAKRIERDDDLAAFALSPADPASLLSLSVSAGNVVLLFDTSGSMEGSEADLQRALAGYIAGAPRGQRIHLVGFSEKVRVLARGEERSFLEETLSQGIEVAGGTSLYDGLQQALDLLDGVTGSRAIVVMGDGIDTSSEATREETFDRAGAAGVPIYSITLGDQVNYHYFDAAATGRELFENLSQITDGRSFHTPEAIDLEEIYLNVLEILSGPEQYEISSEVELGAGTLLVRADRPLLTDEGSPPVHVIMDVSGSMSRQMANGRRRIDEAKQVFNQLLDTLPEGIEFGLTVYGNRIPESQGKDVACRDIETAIEPGPLNSAEVAAFVSALEPAGGTTPLVGSIATVIGAAAPDTNRRIIVITDGVEECSDEPEAVMTALTSQAPDTVELNLIGFDLQDADARRKIAAIADAGGGSFVDARNSEDFASALRSAFTADVEVTDRNGEVVSHGRVGGPAFEVPSGFYGLRLAGGDALGTVEIAPDNQTIVEITSGQEGLFMTGYPPGATPQPRTPACGETAVNADAQGRVRRVQQKLNDLGFDVGAADGIFGPATQRGIGALSEKYGLPLAKGVTVRLEQHLDCIAATGAAYAE